MDKVFHGINVILPLGFCNTTFVVFISLDTPGLTIELFYITGIKVIVIMNRVLEL